MKRIVGLLALVAAIGAVPAIALAEGAGEPVNGVPTMDNARVGVAPASVAPGAEPAGAGAAMQVGAGQSVALMAVGGAALVLGLIIGGSAGTVLAVGGAVLGLLGLYQFLR